MRRRLAAAQELAQILQRQGELDSIVVGALADISCLAGQGEQLAMIIQRGGIKKNPPSGWPGRTTRRIHRRFCLGLVGSGVDNGQ